VGVELYVKPDDRWEANDVADRCHEYAEELLTLMDRADGEPDQAAFSSGSDAAEQSPAESELAR
jgi:hypothetical protein